MKKLVGIVASGLILFSISNIINAEVFIGRFLSGNIKYYTFEGDQALTRSAAPIWNNVSSKVTLTEVTDPNVINIILVSSNYLNPPSPGVLGLTSLYWGQTKVDTTGTWNREYCYQYKSSHFPNNQSRSNTISHEIGHTLSIAHPPATDSVSIMRQGIKSQSTLSAYDRINLIAKWGSQIRVKADTSLIRDVTALAKDGSILTFSDNWPLKKGKQYIVFLGTAEGSDELGILSADNGVFEVEKSRETNFEPLRSEVLAKYLP